MSVNYQSQYFIVIFTFAVCACGLAIVLINVKDDPAARSRKGGGGTKLKKENAIWDVKSKFYLH